MAIKPQVTWIIYLVELKDINSLDLSCKPLYTLSTSCKKVNCASELRKATIIKQYIASIKKKVKGMFSNVFFNFSDHRKITRIFI